MSILCFENFSAETAEKATEYRIIKRAESYKRYIELCDSGPPSKRRKHESFAHDGCRVYARRTASLRRAETLKSSDELGQQASLDAFFLQAC